MPISGNDLANKLRCHRGVFNATDEFCLISLQDELRTTSTTPTATR